MGQTFVLKKNIPTGLSQAEVRTRRKRDGYNELPPPKPKSFFVSLIGVMQEPMLLLLVATATLYLMIGSRDEALMLSSFVFIVISITLYQERRTEKALDALKALASPQAIVIRNGVQRTIPNRELVVDDVVVLNEGERVPADGRLLQCQTLSIDESLISGESLPVKKSLEDNNLLFSGSMVSEGHGLAIVTRIGRETEIGKIGSSLETIERGESHLRIEVSRIIRIFSILAISVSVIVTVYYGLIRSEWVKGILAGLTLAMSLLPEEFPLILTIFLALGAWRMAKINVLARRASVIETLGTTTVLCTDKTGTLTMNKLSVSLLATPTESYSSEEDWMASSDQGLSVLVESSFLGCRPTKPDPIELAIESFCSSYKRFSNSNFVTHTRELLHEFPLSAEHLVRTQVWKELGSDMMRLAAMGAPEAVLNLCTLQHGERESIQRRIKAHSGDGIRLIGIACGELSANKKIPDAPQDLSLTFAGFIGLSDRIRPSVPPAVRACQEAGIRIIMITGDHPETAKAIAEQIGIPSTDEPITGAELETLDHTSLKARLKTCSICARVMPGQKLRIVKALQANGEVVAMTGDGVNDAPCLKAAHVGIAMGQRGTDVAREAADLILLDDDFASIVKGIRHGRRIFDNIRKAFVYTCAVHIPIAGLSLLAIIFKWPLILLPAHIALLELVIDPSCTMSFEAEPEEEDVMQRPPRPTKEKILSVALLTTAVKQGLTVLTAAALAFFLAKLDGYDDNGARTLTYVTLAFANLSLILVNLSRSRNLKESLLILPAPFWWTVIGLNSALAAALFIGPVRNLFAFGVVDAPDLLLATLGGTFSVLVFNRTKKAGLMKRPASLAVVPPA